MGAIFKKGFSFSGYERDLLCLNVAGERYLDISGVSGADAVSDGRGSLFADLDNDGDHDIFLVSLQREAHELFRNNIGHERGFVRVALEGRASGRDAYGAVVRAETSAGTLTKIKSGGSGYLSQSDPRLLFGLGDDPAATSIEVTWPGGATQRVGRVEAGSSIRIVEGEPGFERVAERRFSLPDPLPPGQALAAKLGVAVGGRFPELALSDPASGEPRRVGELLRPGRRLLVNLWATWCVPCAAEIPELVRLAPALEARGIDLVGLSVDVATRDAVREYAETHGIRYPVLTMDEPSVAALYPSGESVVPASLLLDERGRVLEILPGWNATSRRRYEALAAGGR